MKKLIKKVLRFLVCPICSDDMVRIGDKFTCLGCQYEIEE